MRWGSAIAVLTSLMSLMSLTSLAACSSGTSGEGVADDERWTHLETATPPSEAWSPSDDGLDAQEPGLTRDGAILRGEDETYAAAWARSAPAAEGEEICAEAAAWLGEMATTLPGEVPLGGEPPPDALVVDGCLQAVASAGNAPPGSSNTLASTRAADDGWNHVALVAATSDGRQAEIAVGLITQPLSE